MVGSITFGGLFSGLDTKDIVEKLTAVKEQQLLGPINRRLAALKEKSTALTPVQSLFAKLQSSAKVINDAVTNIFTAKTAVSSNTDTVQINAINTSTTIPGTYKVSNISALARPDRVVFDGVANTSSTTHGTGTFAITYKGSTTNIAITSSNNTLEGIVAAINNASAGVTASIINDGSATTPYRLVLTSNDTGSDTTITQTLDPILDLNVDVDDSDGENDPANAAFQVNGVAMTSKSNVVDESIPGVTFTLLETDIVNTITITAKTDIDGMVKKIDEFVDAYNALRSGLKTVLTPDKETNEFGPLGKDLSLTSANIRLNAIMGKTLNSVKGYGYDYSNLAQIGIITDQNGGLSIDTAKLSSRLETDLVNVQKIFQGTTSEDGIAEEMYNYLDTLTEPEGVFAAREVISQNERTYLEKVYTERKSRVAQYRERLEKRFNAMEETIRLLQSKESAINGFLDSMNSN